MRKNFVMDDQTRNETSEELDKFMLDYIRHGEIVLGSDGEPIRDKNGEFLRKRSASMVNAIRQRLKDAGVASAPTQTNSIGQLAQELGGKGKPRPQWKLGDRPVGEIPPIDTETPDAATG